MSKPIIVLGAGGHAGVLVETLRREGATIKAIVAPNLGNRKEFDGIFHIFSDEEVLNYSPDGVYLVNAIGSLPGPHNLRVKLYTTFTDAGYIFTKVVAASAVISQDAALAEDIQILPGAIVNNCYIGANTIVNSGAIIEHDVKIGSNCHIAPGAIVCGEASIGSGVHIGAGATVIQGVSIGDFAVIGAGSVVTENIPSRAIHYPAKPFIKKEM